MWLERASGEELVLYSEPPAFSASDFEVHLNSVHSKDGTLINYYVLSPNRTSSTPKVTPVLITGYGAFGVSFELSYLDPSLGGLSLVPWLKNGGALVIPLSRGGSERGEEWHQAAIREKRQRSYDDFIAVAEKLISDGITTSEQLGFFGLSNRGLLSAVMGTQRPDLFKAIVSDVPLADMIRYPLIGMGQAWVNEYRDPKDPQMAKILLSYSPFHNIRPDVQYPSFLVTVFTKDDQVGPSHARKLIARLKQAGAQPLFQEDQDGRHGVSDFLKNTDLLSKRMAFFFDKLMP